MGWGRLPEITRIITRNKQECKFGHDRNGGVKQTQEAKWYFPVLHYMFIKSYKSLIYTTEMATHSTGIMLKVESV